MTTSVTHVLFQIIFLLLFLPQTSQISFQIPRFDAGAANVVYEGDAIPSVGVVELINKYTYVCRVGRATHVERIPIWNSHTGKVADFTTSFSFDIHRQTGTGYGSGLAFFLAPYGYQMPPNSAGGFLGLLNTTTIDQSSSQIVILEFDPFVNDDWDPKYEHVGININSMASVATAPWNVSLHDGDTVDVVFSYTAATTTLSVNWSYQNTPASPEETTTLTYQIDLAKVLPEWAVVGFSSGTYNDGIRNQIRSWNFDSSLERKFAGPGKGKVTQNTIFIIVLIVVSVVALLLGMFAAYLYFKLKRMEITNTVQSSLPPEGGNQPVSSISEFNSDRGIPFATVKEAVDNFSDERRIGEGRSGSVYQGKLATDTDTAVAVKKIPTRLGQGRMEWINEVKVFSSLRHPNLVQLKAWSHDKDETTFLLVYEFMPNGSLFEHLFQKRSALSWDNRYKISQGLATALLYLHDQYLHKGWKKCVVHRDIKSSNILLDAGLNVKLGDFGVARIMDVEQDQNTTELVGTPGYIDPEYLRTRKASKVSDVYSFGVVILEIATGKSVNNFKSDAEMGLVEWVWDLYGKEELLSAVDKTLLKYDEKQAVCLMTVGLKCAHPDPEERPSIRKAIEILHGDAAMPILPKKMPVPQYDQQPTPPLSVNSDAEGLSAAGLQDGR